jgi:hypothetical protein
MEDFDCWFDNIITEFKLLIVYQHFFPKVHTLPYTVLQFKKKMYKAITDMLRRERNDPNPDVGFSWVCGDDLALDIMGVFVMGKWFVYKRHWVIKSFTTTEMILQRSLLDDVEHCYTLYFVFKDGKKALCDETELPFWLLY